MKKKNIFIISIIIVLIVGIFVLYQQGFLATKNNIGNNNLQTGVNIGNKAPDFTLESLYGNEVTLSDFHGQKVLLNFWASWCGPCRTEMPDLQKLHEKHEDIVILAVNMKEEKNKVLNFIIKNNYSFPITLDKKGEISNKYLVRGIPVSYFLNEEGIIEEKHTGALNYNKMIDLLDLRE